MISTELKELLDYLQDDIELRWMDQDGKDYPCEYFAVLNAKTKQDKIIFYRADMESPWEGRN